MIRLPMFAVIAVAMGASQAVAQAYPSRPIHVIIASPAGNPSDLVVRAAAQEMAPRLGQPVVPENRVGANEIVAHEACAKAAPDGYTMCVVSADGLSYNPFVFSKLPYDPEKDFRPVTRLHFLNGVLAVSAALPVTSVKELQALVASRPGVFNFGLQGVGARQDVLRHWLADRLKADIVGIPYKGTNFIITALLAGDIHLANISMGNAFGLAQAGKIKVLAVESAKRSKLMPDVPTFAEVGLEGAPSRPWWGIGVPAATPDAIVARLNAEFVRVSRDPKFIEFLERRSLEVAMGTPEEFAAFLKADREYAREMVAKYKVPRQ